MQTVNTRTPSKQRPTRSHTTASPPQTSVPPRLARPVVYPISERCMKLDYNGQLDGSGCQRVYRAIQESSQDYPERDLVVVIQDPSNRVLCEAQVLMLEMLPPNMHGRVALVWMSRLVDCDSLLLRPYNSGVEMRLFGAAQYRDALAWLGVVF